MEIKDIFKIIVEEMHTCVLASIDEDLKPITCVMDMMDFDENGIYFLTAKGKSLFNRIINNPYISVSAFKGEETLSSVSISFSGKVKHIGNSKISDLFEKNPYMNEIYSKNSSRDALTVFLIEDIYGELFDLSKKPIYRESFSQNKEVYKKNEYSITNSCIGCSGCKNVCPQDCIDNSSLPFKINENNCLRCGMCFDVCPVGAVIRSK